MKALTFPLEHCEDMKTEKRKETLDKTLASAIIECLIYHNC